MKRLFLLQWIYIERQGKISHMQTYGKQRPKKKQKKSMVGTKGTGGIEEG
jgi:hypothetical protein